MSPRDIIGRMNEMPRVERPQKAAHCARELTERNDVRVGFIETYRQVAAGVAFHVAIVLSAVGGSSVKNAWAAPGEHAFGRQFKKTSVN
jgi:hypothetical protein